MTYKCFSLDSSALSLWRARGAGSEFALAADIRFASRERAVLGQFEIGIGATPGGGPASHLARLVGRGRAMEILVGGEDFDGDLAERYGYVNRAIPDDEFDDFIDRVCVQPAGLSRFARPPVGSGVVPSRGLGLRTRPSGVPTC
jgi:enoyl-CoA hydratase/carnithine racemase